MMPGLSRTTKCLTVVAALAVAAFVLYCSGAIPYRVFVVHTGSMQGSIPSRSAAIVRTGEYHVGRPITYVVNGATVTHRLLAINADGTITTKGDANRSADSQHPPKTSIIGGVVASVPNLGWMLYYVSHVPGALSIILLVSCIWQSNRLAKAFAQEPAVP